MQQPETTKGATAAVRELVAALNENAEFYRTAAANAVQPDLREALRALAEQRAIFARELGVTPGGDDGMILEPGESAGGGLKRGAMTITAGMALQPARMETIVVEGAADMEARLADAYRRALGTDLPAPEHDVARRQWAQVEATRTGMDTAVDTAHATGVGTPANPDGGEPVNVRPALEAAALAAPGDKLALGLFPQAGDAQRAAQELAGAGIAPAAVQVIAQLADARVVVSDRRRPMTLSAAGVGAIAGTVLGIVIGAIAGFGASGVEEVQGALRNEALRATIGILALGSGVGALIGAILAGIIGYSIGESTTHRYLAGVDRGETLVAVRAPHALASRAADILRRSGAHSVRVRTPEQAGQAPYSTSRR